ncbi:caspase family protein [bacterium]|nr:caspase family protein [bacterium]
MEIAIGQTKVNIEGDFKQKLNKQKPPWMISVDSPNKAEWLIESYRGEERLIIANPLASLKMISSGALLGGMIGLIIVLLTDITEDKNDDSYNENDKYVGFTGVTATGVLLGLLACFGEEERSINRVTNLYNNKMSEFTHGHAFELNFERVMRKITNRMMKMSNDHQSPKIEIMKPNKAVSTSDLQLDCRTKDDVRLGQLIVYVNGIKKIDNEFAIEKQKDDRLSIPLRLGPNEVRIDLTDWCGRMTSESFKVFLTAAGSKRTTPSLEVHSKSYPPLLSISNVVFTDETKDEFLDAGEGGILSFRIKNSGRGEASELGISVNVDPKSGISIASRKFPKSVRPNEMVKSEVTVIASAIVPTASTVIELNALDKPTNSPAESVSFEIKTRGRWSDVDLKIPRGKNSNRDGIAVIIGNSNYTDRDVYPVDYALKDAETVRKYVKETLRFNDENILFNTDVTLSELRSLFGTEEDSRGELYNMVRPNVSDLFIFYSGHGAPGLGDKQGYILPVNVSAENAQMNGYSLELLTKTISQIPAKSVTVVIDACFAGLSERGFMIPDASPGAIRVKYPHLQISNGSFFLAAENDQIASWFPEMKHGLFTYFFLKGLRGDADENKDKKITSAELRQFLQEEVPYRVRRLNGRDQRPEIILSNPEKVLVRF